MLQNVGKYESCVSFWKILALFRSVSSWVSRWAHQIPSLCGVGRKLWKRWAAPGAFEIHFGGYDSTERHQTISYGKKDDMPQASNLGEPECLRHQITPERKKQSFWIALSDICIYARCRKMYSEHIDSGYPNPIFFQGNCPETFRNQGSRVYLWSWRKDDLWLRSLTLS